MQAAGRGWRLRFVLHLLAIICRWSKWCRLLPETGCWRKVVGLLHLPESAGGGGGADCWLRLQVEIWVVAVWNLVVRRFRWSKCFQLSFVCRWRLGQQIAGVVWRHSVDLMEAETGYWWRVKQGTSGGLQRL